MYQLSNFNKKDIKVKNYVRKGKLVKSYKKQIDIRSALLGAGGGVLGAGLLGGAFLLGKGRGIKQTTKLLGDMKGEILNAAKHQPNNVDEIVNKVISKIPKQEVNTKQIADDVISKLPKQSNVDSESIIRAVEDKVARNNKQLLSDIDGRLSSVTTKVEQPNSRVIKAESNITPEEVSSNNVKRLIKQSGKKDPFSNVLNPSRQLNADKLNKSFSKLNDTQLDESLNSIVKKWNDIDEALKLPKISKVKKDVLTKLSKRYEEVWTTGRRVKDARINTAFDDFDDFGDDAIKIAKPKITESEQMFLRSAGISEVDEQKIARQEHGIPLSIMKKIRRRFKLNPEKNKAENRYELQNKISTVKILLGERGLGVYKSKPYEIKSYDDDIFSYSHSSIINFRSPICLGDIIYV